jgi:hypothetical protein
LEHTISSTLSFIKNNYGLLKDTTEKLQYSFLYTLLELKTKESFDLFKEIISKKLPAGDNASTLQYSFTDSLALAAVIFPDLLRFSADTGFIKLLPLVADRLLDSALVTTTAIDPYIKYFYSFAEREIKRLKLEKPEYDSRANQLIDFLLHFKDPAAYQLLQQFLSLPAISIKKNAAMALIKNGQSADGLQLEKIANNNYYRIDLYEELKELKKEKLFPVKYFTQRLLAQSALWQAASDDYEPASVQFIVEKTALFMGKQQRFYLFKVVFDYEEGETETFLGVTGPYAKIPGKVISWPDIRGFNRDETFDPKKIDAQLKSFLQQEEEYLHEED